MDAIDLLDMGVDPEDRDEPEYEPLTDAEIAEMNATPEERAAWEAKEYEDAALMAKLRDEADALAESSGFPASCPCRCGSTMFLYADADGQHAHYCHRCLNVIYVYPGEAPLTNAEMAEMEAAWEAKKTAWR